MATPSIQPYAEQGKPYRYAVYFDGPDGSRKRRKFETKKAAEAFLTDKEVEYENLGRTIAADLNDELKRDAHGAQKLLASFGVSLEEAAEHYRKHLLATTKSAPIAGLKDEFLAVKRQNGRSERHIADLGSRLGAFADKFGTRFAADVTSEEIEEWLFGLTDLSNRTRNHYLSKIHSFFAWCVRKRKCASNPVTIIDKSEVPPTTCQIYTATEMRTMLHAAVTWKPTKVKAQGKRGRNRLEFTHKTDDILANIVICGFAGLRQSEFEQLTWDMVKLDRNKIDLPPEITKKKRRKLVTIQPVLAAWLAAHFPARAGLVAGTNFPNRLAAFKRHLKAQHGLVWKHNGLRHSFASYLLEQSQNPGHVAVELGHRGDVGVLWDHYAERVDAGDCKAFWGLTPEVVAAWGASVLQFAPQTNAA